MQAIGSRLVNFCYPTHERYSLSNLLTPFYRRDRPTMEPDFSPITPKDNFKNEFTSTERFRFSNLLTPFYRRDRPTMEPDFSPNPKDNFKNEFTITDQASFPEHPSEKFKWEHKEEQKPPHTW